MHCWWECALVQPLWKTVWRFLTELKIDLPYDPAIALLRIYLKGIDAVKHWDTCTPMFIAVMSTIAKLWKEPQCLSKDEWIKKMWLCIQWNITQPLEMTNTHHLLQRGWNWRVLC